MKGSIFKSILHTVADALTTVAHEVIDESKHVPVEVWARLIERAIKAISPNMAEHPAMGPYASILAQLIAGREPDDEQIGFDFTPDASLTSQVNEIIDNEHAVQAKLAQLAGVAPAPLPPAVEPTPGHVLAQPGYDAHGRRLDAHSAPQAVVHEAPHPYPSVRPQAGYDDYGRPLAQVAEEAARTARAAAPQVAQVAEVAPAVRPDPRRPPVR